MLHFYKLTSPDKVADIVAKRLVAELKKKRRVLWLVCGGSNIAAEAATMAKIPAELQEYLAIMLTDERYGVLGNPDSNIRQLYDAGFRPGKATVVPVLTPEELSLEQTAERYAKAVKVAFENANVIVAQFGIGPDGHIAGALPGSAGASSRKLVVGYDAGAFQRITLTPTALKKINVAYAFAFGDPKRQQLELLRDKKLPLAKQPAQILKQIPESYVYSDVIGENHGK
jgi:6-phosphogluconolactonase/glucosamine-6-phosphate isomerase/deaminase